MLKQVISNEGLQVNFIMNKNEEIIRLKYMFSTNENYISEIMKYSKKEIRKQILKGNTVHSYFYLQTAIDEWNKYKSSLNNN